MRVNGILSLFSFCDVCSVDRLPINLLGAMMVRLNNSSRMAMVKKIVHFI